MKNYLKHFVKSSLSKFNVGITRFDRLQQLEEFRNDKERDKDDIEFLLTLPNPVQLLPLMRKSKAQFRQDLFVLSELEFKRAGFFVEFGATNGIKTSNTYLLEKEFGWHGILAEPAKSWHGELRNNRTAHIETNCVWRDSTSVLKFNEAYIAELSTIHSFSAADCYQETRKDGATYSVQTISLDDLLIKFNAPKRIDYLSIDTEGSEFEILNSFDFGKHQFSVITCEHNFTPMREKIFCLLSENGYVRKFQGLSKFDDWYIKVK